MKLEDLQLPELEGPVVLHWITISDSKTGELICRATPSIDEADPRFKKEFLVCLIEMAEKELAEIER